MDLIVGLPKVRMVDRNDFPMNFPGMVSTMSGDGPSIITTELIKGMGTVYT